MMEGRMHERVISAVKLNLLAVVFSLVAMAALLVLYIALRLPREGEALITINQYFWLKLLGCLVALIALTCLHELLHGLTYKRLGNSETKYGFLPKYLAFYAHAKTPMDITAYRWAVVMPTLVLVPPLLVVGLAAGSPFVYFLGGVMLCGGVGDAAILWMLRRDPKGTMVQDHPSKAGCVVFLRDPDDPEPVHADQGDADGR